MTGAAGGERGSVSGRAGEQGEDNQTAVTVHLECVQRWVESHSPLHRLPLLLSTSGKPLGRAAWQRTHLELSGPVQTVWAQYGIGVHSAGRRRNGGQRMKEEGRGTKGGRDNSVTQ